MENISPLGWAAVACIGVMFVVLNVGLIALLRTKPRLIMKAPQEKNAPRPDQVLALMRDPFGPERKQIDELSGLVGQLGEAEEQEKD
jgi:hypothetical protein